MNLDLSGKVALVSGSTAGIGLRTALQLAQLKAKVIVNGRSQKRVDDAVAHVKKVYPSADVQGVVADLSDAKDAEKLFKLVPKVDVLVNNLGIYEPKSFEQITDDDWRRVFDVNVLSGIRLSRFYFQKMIDNNWGRIVFVSSESAINVPSEMIHYGMTKTAQLSIARGLAELTKGTNVTVNTALVGPTATEGVETYSKHMAKEQNKTDAELEKEFFQTLRPTSLIQRKLTEEEVANLIVYLCSPASSGTNGAAMRVDGGLLRSIV